MRGVLLILALVSCGEAYPSLCGQCSTVPEPPAGQCARYWSPDGACLLVQGDSCGDCSDDLTTKAGERVEVCQTGGELVRWSIVACE